MPLPPLVTTKYQPFLGCDPEFFFEKDGEIIGSEKMIAEQGIQFGNGKMVRDGIQAEFNPAANTCRQSLRYNIEQCFQSLRQRVQTEKGITVNFKSLVEVKKEEMDTLSDKSKQFGCAPSFNVHTPDSKITVNAEEYPFRSAGGHIHLGVVEEWENPGYETSEGWKGPLINAAIRNKELLVPTLDYLVGNTCVMIDRDPGNVERRKVYGRAGEFRTPAHGLEYRVLSNFWLRSYPMMSFVFGMSRQAIHLVAFTNEETNYVKELQSLVPYEDIAKAINENDAKLAKKNFDKIKGFISDVFPVGIHSMDKHNIKEFEYFVKKGIDHWFPQNPLDYWNDRTNMNRGWEAFASNNVREEMNRQKTTFEKAIGMFGITRVK